MKMDQWIRAIAGTFILTSLGLGYFITPPGIYSPPVGLNLSGSRWAWKTGETGVSIVHTAAGCS